MRGIVYLMTVITNLAKAILVMRATQRKLDESKLRDELLAQKARENEIKIQQAQNKLVASDLDIELRTLQVLKLKRDLGLTSQEFHPENYD